MAKIPVLEPDSPRQAKEMIATAYDISEAFQIPVLLRPTTRVCHSRQDIPWEDIRPLERKPDFKKDPGRWAATPKFRYQLHNELERKLSAIAEYEKTQPVRLNPGFASRKAVVSSGVAAAHTRDIFTDLGLWKSLALYQVLQPFPLHKSFESHLLERHQEILLIEETTGVIEMQLANRQQVRGRLTHTVPRTGELLPEIIQGLLCNFMGIEYLRTEPTSAAGKRPTLCPGCPHRASFFAIRKAAPRGIYTGDIGCYTLGLNLGVVDTVLCMGAAISQAAGFYQAYRDDKRRPSLVATIGDSTFFHSGVPPLIDAVVQRVPMLLVIMDNRTTAMTGNQPTPASGMGATGEALASVDLKDLVSGCGVTYCREGDPYLMGELISLLKEALQFTQKEKAPAVVISRHPCVIDRTRKDDEATIVSVEIGRECDGCNYCIRYFECPALVADKENNTVSVDETLCTGCGVCVHVCPKKAIGEKSQLKSGKAEERRRIHRRETAQASKINH